MYRKLAVFDTNNWLYLRNDDDDDDDDNNNVQISMPLSGHNFSGG